MRKYILLFLSVIILCFTGCGSSEEQAEAERIAYDFWGSFQKMDFQHMYSLTNDFAPYYSNVYNPDEELNVKLFKAMGENMEYEITKIEIKGNNANVFYHLKTLNAESLLAGVVTELTENPDADIDKVMENQILRCERINKDTVLNMDKVGDTYVIESNVGIYDDLCGGYLQFIYNTSFITGNENTN